MSGDEYTDDNDLGYDQYDFLENELMSGCSKLTQKYGYPDCAVRRVVRLEVPQKKKFKNGKFEAGVLFPKSDDKIYPM